MFENIGREEKKMKFSKTMIAVAVTGEIIFSEKTWQYITSYIYVYVGYEYKYKR